MSKQEWEEFWKYLLDKAANHDAWWLDDWLEEHLEEFQREGIPLLGLGNECD